MRTHKIRATGDVANGEYDDHKIEGFEGCFILTFLGSAPPINIQGKPSGEYGSVATNQVQVSIVKDGVQGNFFITPQGFKFERNFAKGENLIVRYLVQDQVHIELLTYRRGELTVAM